MPTIDRMSLKERRQKNARRLADTCKDDAEFADKVGITASYASQILNRKGTAKNPKGIGEKIGPRMERVFGKPEGWLDQEHDDEDIVSAGDDRKTSPQEQEVGPGPDLAEVPVLPWSAVGHWLSSGGKLLGLAKKLCPDPHGELTFALELRSASMEPEFRVGELIFVDPSVEPTIGRCVIAQLPGHAEPVFRRFTYEGNTAYLEAINPAWPDRFIPVTSDTRIIGVVIYVGRSV